MRWFAAALLVALAGRAHADVAAAQTLYDQGKQLAADGKYAEACPLFEASYKADAQLGVLLNLADCHERVGKTATAWAEFRTAVDVASKKGDDRESYAKGRVVALEPKLDKLRLAAPAPRPPGLVVTRDDTDVTALLGTDVPVDPGEHVIGATAPGLAAWATRVTVTGEGAMLAVPIGPFVTPERALIVEPVPPKLWSGVRIFAGSSFDGLTANPTTMTQFNGHGPRSLPGVSLAARARLRLAERVSFDPGLGFHLRRIYTEMCVPCVQTDDVHLTDLETFLLMRVGVLTGHTQLGILAGPYTTIRVRAANDTNTMFNPNPTKDATAFDVGVAAAIELFYGRFGAQLQLQYGTQKVSPVLDQPMLGFGLGLGIRI